MQEQMITTTVEKTKKPKVCPQKKHVWMFTIACVILIVGILAQILAITAVNAYVRDMNADFDDSEDAIPGLGALIMGWGTLLILFVGMVASNYLRDLVWIAGLVLSIKLMRRKKEIPTWMWVISLLLLIVYVWCIGSDVLALLAWLFFSLLSKVISLF